MVRLNTKKNGVKITDEQGEEEVPLLIEKGEKREMEGVYYCGQVKVNVAGIFWPKNQKEPLWVMGSLKPDELVEVYEERMKIEQTFKD